MINVSSSREKTVSLALEQNLPSDVRPSTCEFYRLRNPVPVGDSDEPLVQACAVEDKRILVDPMRTKVDNLY